MIIRLPKGPESFQDAENDILFAAIDVGRLRDQDFIHPGNYGIVLRRFSQCFRLREARSHQAWSLR